MVRNVFKIRSLRPCYCHAKRTMLEKRWSIVRSYLCGDEWNSVAADKDSASISSSKGAIIQQEFSSDVAVHDSGSISISSSKGAMIQQEFSSDVAVQDSSDCIWSPKPATRMSCELNSNFEEEDYSSSIRSSEATVTQPILAENLDKDDDANDKYVKTEEQVRMEKPNSTLKLFQQEDAAIVIQSAFRHYLAKRERSENDGMQEVQFPIPSPESFGSSLKVQIGDSTDTSSFDVERDKNVCKPIQKRVRAQALKIQEDWDDSTVSSTISRKRIQNRIEAATRRERALAYAFAQQLRVCSKKKRTKCNSLDSNSSLSWLERWMATRESENMFMDSQRRRAKKAELSSSCKQETIMMDAAVEEKESCGSNEVSLQFHGFSVKTKDKTLTVRNISRRKTVPTTHSAKAASKKSSHLEQEKHKKDNLKQLEIKKNMVKFADSLSTIT